MKQIAALSSCVSRMIRVAPVALLVLGGLAAPVSAVRAAETGTAPAAPADTTAVPAAADSTLPPLSQRVRLSFYPEAGAAGGEEIRPRERSGRITLEDHWDWRNPDGAGFHSRASYDRVQGISLAAGLRRPLVRGDWLPAWHASLGYGFSSHRGTYELGFEQPVAPREKVTAGVDAYRRLAAFFYGDEVIGDGENSASAFFLHRDYRDWYEAEGGRAFVGLHPSPFFTLTAGLTSRTESAAAANTDWSLFRQSWDFRPDPPAASGDYRAFDATLAYDSRPRKGVWADSDPAPRSSWGAVEHWYRIEWERAGAGLGGDFDLWRATADLRTYYRLSARQTLSTRVLAGSGEASAWSLGSGPVVSGVLPPQRRYAIGGMGTLRGHEYRSLAGDHVALANLEYAFHVARTDAALVFVDAGTAWDRGGLADQFIPVDGGAGFRLGEDGVTFLLGKSLNRSGSGVKAFVRFQHSF